MGAKLDAYRVHIAQEATARIVRSERKALANRLQSDLGQARATLAHLTRQVERRRDAGPDWSEVLAAWQAALHHFRQVEDGKADWASWTFCDGRVIKTLEEAEQGLAHAQGKVAEGEALAAALAAAEKRAADLDELLRELAAEG